MAVPTKAFAARIVCNIDVSRVLKRPIGRGGKVVGVNNGIGRVRALPVIPGTVGPIQEPVNLERVDEDHTDLKRDSRSRTKSLAQRIKYIGAGAVGNELEIKRVRVSLNFCASSGRRPARSALAAARSRVSDQGSQRTNRTTFSPDSKALDRPPNNRPSWEVSFATKSALRGRRFCREEEAFFGRTHSGDLEGGRPGDSDLGALSAARDF